MEFYLFIYKNIYIHKYKGDMEWVKVGLLFPSPEKL